MRRFILLAVLLIFFLPLLKGQPSGRRVPMEKYVDRWKDVAIRHMHQYGIPASITLAQGILESGYGNSPLARYANNHFGIKCNGWEGRKFYKDDDHEDDCFRKYYNAERSYEDHAEFLTSRGRYSFLFELRPNNYRAWARGLKQAGYATDPSYPDRLITLIERRDLHRFDTLSTMEKRTPKAQEKERRKLENVETRGGRRVYRHPNSIDLVKVRPGDSFDSLAADLDISKERLLRYNDMNPTDRLSPGDTVYIQPKRNWSRDRKIYRAEKGETMWKIAHRFGLKLEKLYERNNMIPGTQPEPGQRIFLRGQREAPEEESTGFWERLFGKKKEK
ncbi:MAG: glucosaminidase domain-containing protein [Flavobacteriales bacterium]